MAPIMTESESIDTRPKNIPPLEDDTTNTSASFDPIKENESDLLTRSESSSHTYTDDELPIRYHYLTYGIELPSPVITISDDAHSAHNGEAPPPCPNLKKYEDPFEWSKGRKNFIIILSCIATMLTAYTAGAYAPAVYGMSEEFGVSHVAALVGITTFCAGFAIAPMFLSPFSELNGRYPVFVVAGVLYEICQICCAITQSYTGMLLARFFGGIGSSVFSTMVGGVVSDLYHAEERNTPMALFSGAALFGTGLGPLVSGFVAQNLDWRWVFWVQSISCGILVVAVAAFFSETRGSILLSRKASALNNWYETREKAGYIGVLMPVDASQYEKKGDTEIQRVRWKVKSDEERASLAQMVKISVVRPFHLLFTEPVVFCFSVWISFAWAVLYLTFGAIGLVYIGTYGFSLEQAYAPFAAMSIGSFLATCYSIYQERFTDRLFIPLITRITGRTIDPANNPERRLYFSCFQSLLLPISLFWFGWSLYPSVPWIVPTLAVGCATMGIYSVYLATFNYLADAYHRYASSALAAQSFCKCALPCG